MTEKPRETQAELHVVELKEKVNNSSLMKHPDFTDYVRVICKKDNWRNVFAPFFGREPSVRESFQRLYPVRLDTMHARPVTQSDELLLYVETRHLCALILGKEKS